MAYEVKQGGEPQQAAGSTPLSQGSTPVADQSQPQGQSTPSQPSSTPATIQTGASVNQATTQGNAQNRKSGTASSGMFTNVQRYVERNRPQAQKMAQAVTQDFSKQASQIADQANKQRAQQQQQIQANQAQLQSQFGEAQRAVEQITAPQPRTDLVQRPSIPTEQTQAPQEPVADAERFQQLMQGPVGVQQVADLNLGQQSSRAQALSNLAQGANRESFRRNLMGETFGNRQYTRGQSALDNLILGGDQGAREAIIQGTQGEAERLNKQLQDIGAASRQDVAGLQQDIDQFGGRVRGLATDAESAVESELDQGLESFLQERQRLLQDEYGNITQGLKTRQQEILDYLGADANFGQGYSDAENLARRYAQVLMGQNENLKDRGNKQIGGLASGQGGIFAEDPNTGLNRYMSFDEIDADNQYLQRIDENAFYRANEELLNRLGYGTEADLGLRNIDQVRGDYWDKSQSSSKSKSDQRFRIDSLANAFRNIAESQKNLNFDDQIKQALSGASGVGYDQLLEGSDVDRYDVADQAKLEQFNKLQELLGEEGDVVVDEMLNPNYATNEALSSILNKYRIK